jgi:hypothetical protein
MQCQSPRIGSVQKLEILFAVCNTMSEVAQRTGRAYSTMHTLPRVRMRNAQVQNILGDIAFGLLK